MRGDEIPRNESSKNPMKLLLSLPRVALVSLVALTADATFTLPASADEKPANHHQAGNPQATVFAIGLTNPRHIRFGPDGLLYVAEAGTGGDLTANTPGCPAADNLFTTPPLSGYRSGFTGRISRVLTDGTQQTVAQGLPSSRDGFEDSFGPTDIAWIGRAAYVLLQGGGCSRGLPDHPTGIVRLNRHGSYSYVADISAFIRANPPIVEPLCGPDGDCEPDGVPHTMMTDGNWIYIVEANHNSILRINPDTGAIERIHDLSVQDPAPTTMARQGNRIYLGAFDGLILTYNRPGGAVTTMDQGYGGIVDLATVGTSIYVLETSSAETPFAPNNGSLIRRDKNGNRTVLASQLNYPVGMAHSFREKALYVSTVGFGQGTTEGLGQIVRINLAKNNDEEKDNQ
jgi:hypothetical protein